MPRPPSPAALLAWTGLLVLAGGVVWMRSAPPIVAMRFDDYPEPLALPAFGPGARAEAVVRAAEAAEQRACRGITAGRPSIVCEAR